MLQVVDFLALAKCSCDVCPVNHLLIISNISQSATVTPVCASTITIQNSITIQRQCVCAPSAIKNNSGTQARYVTIACCTVANLWRQHELSVASTCFVCWFHQFFRRVYLKSANKYSGETCALAPIHASNWEPWASRVQDAPSLERLLHYSWEM